MPALGCVQGMEASSFLLKDSSLLRINDLLLRTVNSRMDHEHAGQEGKLALTALG